MKNTSKKYTGQCRKMTEKKEEEANVSKSQLPAITKTINTITFVLCHSTA